MAARTTRTTRTTQPKPTTDKEPTVTEPAAPAATTPEKPSQATEPAPTPDKASTTAPASQDAATDAYEPTVTLHKVSNEQRRANADSGTTTAYWQAFALVTSGKSVEDAAEILARSQRTVRQWHYVIALAVALAGGTPEETADGLPPARIAAFTPAAEQAIRPLLRATAKDDNQTALMAAVANAHKLRAMQTVTAATAVAAQTGAGKVTEHEVTEYVDQIIPAQVAAAVETRAKEITDAKAAAAKAEAEAEQRRKEAAEQASKTDEERAAEEAQRRKARAAAIDQFTTDTANGPVHEWLSTVTVLAQRMHARVKNAQQSKHPVKFSPEEIEHTDAVAAMLHEVATMARGNSTAPRPPARRK